MLFLLGTVLSHTDPVFASAIVGRNEVPDQLRYLLNVGGLVNKFLPSIRASVLGRGALSLRRAMRLEQ